MTKVLTELSTVMSNPEVDKSKVKDILKRVEELRQEILDILDKLEACCEKDNKTELAKQYGDEYEEFNDKIDQETSNVRAYLNKLALVSQGTVTTLEVSEDSNTSIATSSPMGETHRQLERIRILIFTGDKLKF